MDPAGSARTAVGPTVRGEYERAGLPGRYGLETWPVSPKADGLQLVEAMLCSADGTVSLMIHPRCRRLITALQSYARARRAGQWMDYPEDPQHPHEDDRPIVRWPQAGISGRPCAITRAASRRGRPGRLNRPIIKINNCKLDSVRIVWATPFLADDGVARQVESPKAGEFAMRLRYSCMDLVMYPLMLVLLAPLVWHLFKS